ncbi:MAG: ribonuclease H-like domain-containing protein [bacterium]|nr:ribonuclease H-like domain-containing protein [bacterium]
MSKLILDIETIGDDFDVLDKTTQESLTQWIKKESANEKEYQEELEELKNRMGFSPLTGQIVAIGVLDYEKDKGVVYFQAPGEKISEFTEGNFTFKPMPEKEMLQSFWQGAQAYTEFISFNGRQFDAPFLAIRSAIHQIKISKDLLSNRYVNSQKFGTTHIDLLDQLTFYGALRGKRSLHLWCHAFGIESPKAGGVTGDDVAGLFKEKKFADIARYNTGDLIATKKLYDYWMNYVRAG